VSIDVLFIHPNFPGQFLRLARHLALQSGYRVRALRDTAKQTTEPLVPGVELFGYALPPGDANDPSPQWARHFSAAVERGQVVARALLQMKLEGYEPHLIYAHTGWGDTLYLKELFPQVPVVGLFEYYYHSRGADVGFDPDYPLTLSDVFRVPLLNASQLMALETCDVHLTPTEWQRSRYPDTWRSRMRCLHEGVNTDIVQPDPEASFMLPDGRVLRAGDEVLTYACRGFEPCRGVEVFMRALPRILEQRPDCQVLLVGSSRHYYGPAPAGHATWLDKCLAGLEQPLDPNRVHFLGFVDYPRYLSMLQVSRAHVYMTYPFVLSWSMLEAMAAGCVVVGSDTAPVREVIANEVNGLLFPFFDDAALVQQVARALADPLALQPLRAAAVSTIKKRYDFDHVVLPQHLQLLDSLLAPGRTGDAAQIILKGAL